MLLVVPVAAATSQGLEWGITVGDQWNYDMTMTEEGTVTDSEVIYMEITSRPTIANIINTWLELPASNSMLDITWANGTSLGWSGLLFIFMFFVIDQFLVPVGNYTFLTELYETSIHNATIFDRGGYWGGEVTDEWSGASYSVTVDFLKEDGMLAHYIVETSNTTSGEVMGSFEVVRQGLPSFDIVGLIQDNIIIVAAAVGVVLILAIVCLRRK
jgi:hypothetical protein